MPHEGLWAPGWREAVKCYETIVWKVTARYCLFPTQWGSRGSKTQPGQALFWHKVQLTQPNWETGLFRRPLVSRIGWYSLGIRCHISSSPSLFPGVSGPVVCWLTKQVGFLPVFALVDSEKGDTSGALPPSSAPGHCLPEGVSGAEPGVSSPLLSTKTFWFQESYFGDQGGSWAKTGWLCL